MSFAPKGTSEGDFIGDLGVEADLIDGWTDIGLGCCTTAPSQQLTAAGEVVDDLMRLS